MKTPPHDADLPALLRDAVAGIQPHHGPADIRARARTGVEAPSTARRWVPVTVAAAVATATVMGGTAWFARQDQADSTLRGPTAPAPSSGGSQNAATSAPGNPLDVVAYYAGTAAAGPRLFKERHAVDPAGRDGVQAAVDEALDTAPQDPDYRRSPLSGATARVSTGAGLITIDLSGVDSSATGAGETALQALVWTADAATGTDYPVRFLLDGAPVASLLGVDTTSPLSRASSDSVLSPVSMTTPAQGATLPTRFEVTGDAATFEGNVVWELKRGDTVVRSGYTTTREAFVQSPYAFEVEATPGDYTLVVHDTDESGGEGTAVTEDTRDITVRAGF